MRFLKIALPLLFLIILSFIGYTLYATGFFRNIDAHFEGRLIQKVALKGAEDITISHDDSFALVSATERAGFPENPDLEGDIYLLDLLTGIYEPLNLSDSFSKPFAPHGISFFKTDSTYTIMAINHAKGIESIEVFELKGGTLQHKKTLKDPAMIRPNDLVMLDSERFYFSNDHHYTEGVLKLLEEFGGFAWSNVVYFDGKNYREVAKGIAYANGINFDPKRKLLFVASPRHFLVKVYAQSNNGSLEFVENINCGTGVDNIEFDEDGKLWIGCHPNLNEFAEYAKGNSDTAPSEIIKIDYRAKEDYSIETIYLDDGNEMSGCSVAAPFEDLILTGNVMDDAFLILKR